MAVIAPKIEGGILRKDVYFAETEYEPHEGQIPIHYDGHRHRALSNGRRWGKTYLGAKEVEPTCFVKNRLGEPQRGWIIGPNYSDCEKEFRIIYNSLKALGVDDVSTKFTNNVENGNMVIKTNWGWALECRSAAHPESLVGEGLDFVLLVEAGRLHRRTFTEYVRPALSDKRGWSIMSGVPEIASDTSLLYWGYTKGIDHVNKPWRSWRMPSWTNNIVFPGGRNDPEILEAEDDLTEEEFRRQYGGEFVDRVGRVMVEWDDQVHLAPLDYNPELPLYAAVDYGWTNWWVWLWIQVDHWGKVYVIREHYFKHRDTQDIAQELKRHPLMNHLVAFYPDPHSPDDTNILMRELKKPARSNTGGEIKTRLAMIRQKLKVSNPEAEESEWESDIVVDSRNCPRFVWEMSQGYRWPQHKSDTKSDSEIPMDKDNHGPEAFSRFIRGYFSITGEEGGTRIRRAKTGYGQGKHQTRIRRR